MDEMMLLQRVVDQTTRVVDHVSDAQMANPSPCEGWCVRDVLNHITGGATMFAVSAEEGSVPEAMLGQLMGGDNLGDDGKRAWAVASARALTAFAIPGVLDQMVALPFGEMPGRAALNIAVFDVLTHAADIASSTGQRLDDAGLVDVAIAIGREMIGPELRQPGVFDLEQVVAPDASPDARLLAFAGRRI